MKLSIWIEMRSSNQPITLHNCTQYWTHCRVALLTKTKSWTPTATHDSHPTTVVSIGARVGSRLARRVRKSSGSPQCELVAPRPPLLPAKKGQLQLRSSWHTFCSYLGIIGPPFLCLWSKCKNMKQNQKVNKKTLWLISEVVRQMGLPLNPPLKKVTFVTITNQLMTKPPKLIPRVVFWQSNPRLMGAILC